MNKRDRVEQRRIVTKAIRAAMRKWAQAKGRYYRRPNDLSTYRVDDLKQEWSDAHSALLAIRSLAADLRIVDYFDARIVRRCDSIIEARATRRPFRHLKAVNS